MNHIASGSAVAGRRAPTSAGAPPPCRVAVGIPTIGRADILRETLRELAGQTHPADAVIVCGTSRSDISGAEAAYPGVQILISNAGLPRQRNAIMAATDADIVVFFDDDFLPDAGYLGTIVDHMTRDPRIVVATGTVLADGICGPGLTPREGKEILTRSAIEASGVRPVFSGYGCNMAVRRAAVLAHAVWFDERLPLYGWQEDVDFSRRLAAWGSVVKVEAARGVHLGVKSGRNSGVRLGYSQVANPLYLSRKRCGYPYRRALSHITCNVAMNIVRASWPEAHIDRIGRLRGNALALFDLLTGRMVPERILGL